MNIYKQIEKIFENEGTLPPSWAMELLSEIREIKAQLSVQTQKIERNSADFYRYVNELRNSMRADTVNNIFPEVMYDNRRLGITFKGLLYDKKTTELLPTEEAFRAYQYLYNHKVKAI